MRGRPKTSETLHNLRGNPGRRKKTPSKNANFEEVSPKNQKLFGLPSGLPKTVRRRAALCAKHLEATCVSVKMYRSMFAAYCDHLRFEYEAAKTLKKEGLTTTGKFGLTEHPAVKIHKANSKAARDIEKFFSQLLRDAPHSGGKSPLDDWINGGQRPKLVK